MQDTGVTNSVSPMYGSTTNPIGENCIEVDGQSSQQSEHEYINLDDQTVPTQDTNEDPGERDIGNNNGEDELELKSKRQKTSKVWGDFIQVTLPDGICKTLPVIAPNAKYDANKMREAITSWLMVTEQPFSIVEDEMFIYMMNTANPLFGRISKPTAKADCFKVYEHEKKKLKALTNALSNISLTEVVTSEDRGKIFSIFVDNAAYNDKVVKTLKTNFSIVKKLPCEGRRCKQQPFDMLSLALNFKDVFPRYAEYEPHFIHLPSDEDWDNVTAVCEVLKVFKVSNEVANNTKEVSDALDHMFKEYVEMHDELVREAASYKNRSCGESTNSRSNEDLLGSGRILNFFNKRCRWREYCWNVHQLKYPVLSKMAKDVLATLISTIAFEATFSVGGRVIDPYQSVLKFSTL
ncbi:zinc finger BED domain-containing protein RICESLEEPER 2-like protein [Tanacetum coccineum]